MRHWRTTRNSNVAIQTESTYISDSMTDINTLPTANLGFLTTASSQKVSTSDYDIERQPEIATWPPKPEIAIPLEIQQIASKFQRQIRDFRPWRAQIKCRQVIAKWPTTGNGNVAPKPEILLELWQIGWQFQGQIWGFRPRPERRNWPPTTATTTETRNGYRRFGRQT